MRGIKYVDGLGIAIIKKFEGFRKRIYQCPAGYLTIGYGHVIRSSEDFTNGITELEAKCLLRKDLSIAEHAVSRLINVPLTECQSDALISFTFNLGTGALQRSTLRRKVNRQQHDAVPAEFMRWVWAGGRKLPGLINRRAAEANLYKTPS